MLFVIDLDNTLVELSRSVARLLGRHDLAEDPTYPRTYGWAENFGIANDELWKQVDAAGAEFWATLPWTSWGEQTLDTVRKTGHDIIICSAIVGPGSAAGKKIWAQKNLPSGIPLFLTDNIKWPLAQPGRVLIDDAPKNCEAWELHGGTAILVPQTYNNNSRLVGREYEFITKELWAIDLLVD